VVIRQGSGEGGNRLSHFANFLYPYCDVEFIDGLGASGGTFWSDGTVVLLASVAVIWRHNQLVYPRQYAEWDRSFGVSHRSASK